MKNLMITRPGLIMALALLILITTLGVSVAQEDLAAMIRTVAEERPAQEQPQTPTQATTYDLSWWTVDGGGTTSGGGSSYALGGTAGQPDAAVWSGGDYVLAGGFWGGAVIEYRIFLPLMMHGA